LFLLHVAERRQSGAKWFGTPSQGEEFGFEPRYRHQIQYRQSPGLKRARDTSGI